jgi:hypothetical protein
MRGLLADINIQGHLVYLRQLLEARGLSPLLAASGLDLVTFPDIGLTSNLDDRTLWHCCQEQGWVLFTENRNHDLPDSLNATLADAWRPGHLPVLTLAKKRRFQYNPAYAARVADSVAELLLDILHEQYRDQPRIYVPHR